MKATLIDMNQYVKAGEGANGASYNNINDPNEMIKLYFEAYPIASIEEEVVAAHKVYDLGIPSPKPGELITDGKRVGIRFFRILNKRSFARAVSEEPERCEEYAREFANMCKDMHKVHCPADQIIDVKKQYKGFLAGDKEFTAAEKDKIAAFIDAMPDADTALHGDMHFGNAVTNLPNGAPMSTPHDNFFIDLGAFAMGTPRMDIAMLALCCLHDDEPFIQENFHFSKAIAEEFWKYFADEYFFKEDNLGEKLFGKGKKLADIEHDLIPYVGLKTFLIENDCGVALPPFVKLIRESILK